MAVQFLAVVVAIFVLAPSYAGREVATFVKSYRKAMKEE